jgi:hypothetical protein
LTARMPAALSRVASSTLCVVVAMTKPHQPVVSS